MDSSLPIYVEVYCQKTRNFISIRLDNIASITFTTETIPNVAVVLFRPENTKITLTHELAEGFVEAYKSARPFSQACLVIKP